MRRAAFARAQGQNDRNTGRWSARAGRLVLALAGLALPGCAQLWDDLTAHSPEGGFVNDMRYRCRLLFTRPDPFTVLAENKTDGDLRARAYRALPEPREHGGTEEEQTLVLKLLAAGAREEKDTICRLAAIERLGTFKDPRVTQLLLEDSAAGPSPLYDKSPVVRMAVLKLLAARGEPAAVDKLAEALARDPDPDVRITAAKGLGHFQTDRATAALVQALKEQEQKSVRERHGALQHEVGLALRRITGKELPAESAAWEDYLRNTPAAEQERIAREAHKPLVKLASWFEDAP